jgi:hypothetical protein
MARALTVVGALLAVAFGVLLLAVFATRDEDRVAVDDILALEITRAIGSSDSVDLRRLARGDWDRVLVVAPGTPRDSISDALGSEFNGDLPFGSSGELLVFAAGDSLVRFADYRGRATFAGFEEPVDELARADAVLQVRGGVVRLVSRARTRGTVSDAVRMTGGVTYSGGARGAAPSSSRAPLPSPGGRACAVPGRAVRPASRGRPRAGSCARRA